MRPWTVLYTVWSRPGTFCSRSASVRVAIFCASFWWPALSDSMAASQADSLLSVTGGQSSSPFRSTAWPLRRFSTASCQAVTCSTISQMLWAWVMGLAAAWSTWICCTNSKSAGARLDGDALADLLGQALMHAPRALFGGTQQHDRHRSGDGHDDPHQAGEQKAAQGDHFENHHMAGRVMAHQAEGNQKKPGGNGGDGNQSEVNHAMQHALGAAVRALGQVLFVVAAHFRHNPANVIAPSRQDAPHYAVNAFVLSHEINGPCSSAPGD